MISSVSKLHTCKHALKCIDLYTGFCLGKIKANMTQKINTHLLDDLQNVVCAKHFWMTGLSIVPSC